MDFKSVLSTLLVFFLLKNALAAKLRPRTLHPTDADRKAYVQMHNDVRRNVSFLFVFDKYIKLSSSKLQIYYALSFFNGQSLVFMSDTNNDLIQVKRSVNQFLFCIIKYRTDTFSHRWARSFIKKFFACQTCHG